MDMACTHVEEVEVDNRLREKEELVFVAGRCRAPPRLVPAALPTTRTMLANALHDNRVY
jgi:hypothetical protein